LQLTTIGNGLRQPLPSIANSAPDLPTTSWAPSRLHLDLADSGKKRLARAELIRDASMQIIDMKDLRYWYFEPYPFVLMLYEATRNIGLWLHIQNYVDMNSQIMDSGADTVTLRILRATS